MIDFCFWITFIFFEIDCLNQARRVEMSTQPIDKQLSVKLQQQPTLGKIPNERNDLLSELKKNLDIDCEEFQDECFDCKKYTNAIIKTRILGDHLAKLTQCIFALDEQIRDQISLHHDDLLHQAMNIESLEEMLDMVQSRIISLKSTSERLRVKITSPFNELNMRIIQLSRLQAACDMLRRIKGMFELWK
jgi:hypothetical protein